MDGVAHLDYDSFDAELLAKIDGTKLHVGYHNPFLLTDSDMIWLVLKGCVDVHAVPLRDGAPVGTGRHLFRIEEGGLVFGMAPITATPDSDLPPGAEIGLRAVAIMGTELYRASRSDIEQEDFDLIVVDWIDRWVADLAGALAPAGEPRSNGFLEAEPGVPHAAGIVLAAQRGDVVWVSADAGGARLLDIEQIPASAEGLAMPVTGTMWVTCDTDCALSAAYTPTALFRGMLWRSLDVFHTVAMMLVAGLMVSEAATEQARIARKSEASRATFRSALERIGGVLMPARAEDTSRPGGDDPLRGAVELVARAAGIALARSRPNEARGLLHPLDDIARHSQFRTRRIMLPEGWHRRDSGPILGYMKEDDRPVALLPAGRDRYRMVDPAGGPPRMIDDALAARISGAGHVLYRPLPARALRVRDVLAFGMRGLRPDFIIVGLMGLLGGLIALATPIATGEIFSSIIPHADMDMHLMVIAGLVLAALASTVFSFTRSIAILRIQTRMDASIQTAVWDRLLSLPAPFFRHYSSGDLADRANGINAIRQILTGTVMQAILDTAFSLFSLALLFWYSGRLAMIALGIVLAMIGLSVAITFVQVPLQRRMIERSGRIDGLVFQLLSGITKLRVSASEPRAFARWAQEFAVAKELTYRMRRLAALQAVISGAFPLLASLILFASVTAMLGGIAGDGFGIGDFLSFNAAFGQFAGAMVGLFGAASTLIGVVPLYERVSPILESIPEVSDMRGDPGQVRGDIEFSHVTFRYDAGRSPIIDDVSLSIPRGGYVALVGPSGSGKSTLVRLLLGFENPEAGGVYLDGKDLAGLDMPSLRRQVGVVLQNGRLMSGSIFDNIVGSLPLTLDDAWEAARLSGLADDIMAMPMGMHTVLSEGAGTLSGGQRQRLMIARALVHKPRILILDEATSALDNRTQAIVNGSLAKMNMTRIVVAHRLSTIENVDRIFVMRAGRLVEQGDFAGLMAMDGEFAALARRQLVE